MNLRNMFLNIFKQFWIITSIKFTIQKLTNKIKVSVVVFFSDATFLMFSVETDLTQRETQSVTVIEEVFCEFILHVYLTL